MDHYPDQLSFSDNPKGHSKVIHAFLHGMNDYLSAHERQLLIPLIQKYHFTRKDNYIEKLIVELIIDSLFSDIVPYCVSQVGYTRKAEIISKVTIKSIIRIEVLEFLREMNEELEDTLPLYDYLIPAKQSDKQQFLYCCNSRIRKYVRPLYMATSAGNYKHNELVGELLRSCFVSHQIVLMRRLDRELENPLKPGILTSNIRLKVFQLSDRMLEHYLGD